MGLKEKLENNPTLIILSTLLVGFLAGVATVNFLEDREEALRTRILAELQADNKNLKTSNEELDKAVREILIKYVTIAAIQDGKPLGGENADIPKIKEGILKADRGEISKIIKDPARIFGKGFGPGFGF